MYDRSKLLYMRQVVQHLSCTIAHDVRVLDAFTFKWDEAQELARDRIGMLRSRSSEQHEHKEGATITAASVQPWRSHRPLKRVKIEPIGPRRFTCSSAILVVSLLFHRDPRTAR